MKNFKRKLAGLLVFAMVLGIMAPGVVAQAAEESATFEFQPDYAKEEVTLVHPSSVAAIRYGEVKGDTVTDKEKEKFDEVDVKENSTGTSIDISWVKKNKPASIAFQYKETENGEWQDVPGLFTTPTQTTTIKVALSPSSSTAILSTKEARQIADGMATGSKDTGYIIVYDAKSKETPVVITPSSIMWKKGASGTWQEMSKLTSNLNKFKAKGATLYFQVKDSETAWPSKEVKFSYKKQANAPKIKTDVSKYTLGLKLDQEYSLDKKNWISVKDALKNAGLAEDSKGLKKLTLEHIIPSSAAVTVAGIQEGKTVKLYVRTVKANTVPSKNCTVTLKASTFAGIVSEAGLSVSYDSEKEGWAITNTSNVAYEYAFTETTTGAVDVSDVKWIKIAAKKDDKVKPVMVTEKNADKAKAEAIVIRVAGIKGKAATKNAKAIEERLASKYVPVDLVELKANGATVISNAAVVGNTSFSAVKGADGVYTVSGTAVSGKSVDVTVEIEMANLSTFVTKITADKKVGEVAAAKVVVVESGKITDSKAKITITIPADAALKGSVTVNFGKTKVKLGVDIAAAK